MCCEKRQMYCPLILHSDLLWHCLYNISSILKQNILKPVNVSTPAFRIYDHEINQVLADDTKTHLNLLKMATRA